MLKELFYDLDRVEHLDAAIYVVATITFYGQLHLGEICTSKEAYMVFNHATTPSHKHLKPPHMDTSSRMLCLPWTKVKRTSGDDVAICRQRGVTDPIRALEQHMQINSIIDLDTALASYYTTTGMHKLLTVSKFIKHCNKIWQKHDRARFTGHSF